MCRWNVFQLVQHERIQTLDYYCRLDTHSFVRSPLSFDIFDFMAARQLKYGFVGIEEEPAQVITGANALHQALFMQRGELACWRTGPSMQSSIPSAVQGCGISQRRTCIMQARLRTRRHAARWQLRMASPTASLRRRTATKWCVLVPASLMYTVGPRRQESLFCEVVALWQIMRAYGFPTVAANHR